MSSTIVQRLIGLISGEVGGNIAGAILKKFSLGPIGNTITGILGGGLGEQLLNRTGVLQNGGLIGDIAGSAVGGAVVMAIVGLIENAMVKQSA
jgi:uncharacterized membrane protein YeaQ/YmgE (transglycosylase-associated protein family)